MPPQIGSTGSTCRQATGPRSTTIGSTDPEIGGVLTKYMSSENARSWIKDGPMKEYGRARLGAGRYARFGTSVGPTARAARPTRSRLGAAVVDNSQGVKPFHCLAKMDGATTYVAWDAAKNLRHLVWADDQPPREQPEPRALHRDLGDAWITPSPRRRRRSHTRIAERCSIAIKYYRVAARASRRAASSRDARSQGDLPHHVGGQAYRHPTRDGLAP